MDMTPDEFSKWSITHKSRKTLKTQQTILVGTSSIPNKSQAGRHTAKQGVFCSQYRFLLLSRNYSAPHPKNLIDLT